jgi:hypothetical protein
MACAHAGEEIIMLATATARAGNRIAGLSLSSLDQNAAVTVTVSE